MRRITLPVLLVFAALLAGCSESEEDQARTFLAGYNHEYQKLAYAAAEAEWTSNTHIVEGDTTNAYRTRMANEALAAFTGSKENIETARRLLVERAQMSDLAVRQLEKVLYMAGNNPQTVPEMVKERIKAEALQTEALYGFDFKVGGASVSTNDIDNILKTETDLDARLEAWEASKEVGVELADGLVELQRLRNSTVRALGYEDYFSYQVSDYGMHAEEMLELNLQLVRELRPLYREIHTYVRYMLAKRYGQRVPNLIPAHWLPNRWGQDWTPLVSVEGLDLDKELSTKPPEWLVKQAERFYVSLGFEKLPESFWTKSDLYPLPEDAAYKKNNHASAWHMDLQDDVRCLMSIIPNAEWYETTHHELGHIYYYLEYSNPNVPIILRSGANRAFHEGIGSLMGLAAMQKPFLQGIDLFPEDAETDEIQSLFKEALNYVVFIPWAAGVMTQFEYELYARELPRDQFNSRWWELKRQFQGIAPPSQRGPEYCDPASKTHISDDAAQYYDYALSYALLFQFHDYIARNILQQDPHSTNYYGSKDVGAFLSTVLQPGASRDWRELMQETLGEGMSADAMLRYFDPLMEWLREQNKGRIHTLPEV
ncbi:MAG: M2 family metallopeptidase [Candidatus Latescibacterota bacterium]|jgi:peptidyl-dipeptidase A